MEIPAPKGERTQVIYLWGSTVPGELRFSARTVTGESATGKVEVVTRRLTGASTDEYPLAGQNIVAKNHKFASYKVFVTPDEDTTVYFETSHIQAHHLLRLLVILAVVLGALALVPYMLEFIDAL